MVRHPLKHPTLRWLESPRPLRWPKPKGTAVHGGGRSTVNGDPVRDLRATKPKGRVGVAPDKATALAYEHPHGGGYMEKTNWMFHYVNVPAGYRCRSVVQYNPKTRTLEPRAHIVHSRNGYSVQEGLIQGKIPLAQAFTAE